MSDSAPTDRVESRKPIEGILPLLTAFLLTAVYYRVQVISENWSMPGHILFRGFVLVIGVVGAMQFLKSFNRRFRIPSWMRLSQHWMSIPLEGWIYLGIMFVLFTGAMLTKQNTLMLVFAFMAGPFVINGWMTYGMLKAADVQRQVPTRAMQGELFSVELSLSNKRPVIAIWMMSVSDEIKHSRETLEGTVLFSRVSPRTTQTGQYQLRLSHRGRYRLGPLRIVSRFPLGLVERSRFFSVTDEVLIYPRIGRISPAWRQKLVGATELVSRNQPHRGVFNDDFHRLREFRSGDNPRAIHWRSTARRGEIILREFHQNRDHTLAVVLDLFRNVSSQQANDELVEFALSFVASLLTERGRECHDGYLSLAASGEKILRWEGQGHASSLEQLFDSLAVFESGLSHDATAILTETLQQAASSTQILLVTTRAVTLPYQSLLTSRVEVLNLNDISIDSLLIFEEDHQESRVVV